MEFLELILENLEDRINEALAQVSPPGQPVTLGTPLYTSGDLAKESYQSERTNNGSAHSDNPHRNNSRST
jgi:hypothetical protein